MKITISLRGTRKNGPRKNVLQKLFSVKRMLENLNDFFIFIDWFHYTHKKMFDVQLMTLHAPNCRILQESRKVFFEFWVFIDWSHPNIPHTQTHHDARRSPHDFLFPSFGFVVVFWVFIDWSHPNIPYTHHDARAPPMIFCFWIFRNLFSRGPFFRAFFSRGSFFWDHFSGITLRWPYW